MNVKGFRSKVNFFVSEVSFEKLLKVLGLAYVFENVEKCNFVYLCVMFLDFVYFVFLGRGLEAK